MNDKIELKCKPDKFTLLPNADNYFENKQADALLKSIEAVQPLTPEQRAAYNASRQKIYSNQNFVNITIERNKPKPLKIEFNPNIISGYNPLSNIPLDYKEFNYSLDFIQETVYESGLDVNIRDLPLTRYHTCFDVPTPRDYNEYYPIISLHTITRNAIKGAQNRTFENTFYIQNKNRAAVVYDKQNESGLTAPCMRFELKNEIIPLNYQKIVGSITENYFHKNRRKAYELLNRQFFHDSLKSKVIADLYITDLLSGSFDELSLPELYKQGFFQRLSIETGYSELDLRKLIVTPSGRNELKEKRRRFFNDMRNYKFIPGTMLNLYNELHELFKKVA